ncbi:MAG TPA: thiol peroxidase [Clostridium sp.]|jgi:thiol peroxidase|uniref:Thiol peroxidase n=1 Tax=Clostridium lapidicellarium TaxID=3240931 RepID=A0ABV4DX50_9CLOT|nr:thiol peroxidase [uncultured Clostridium sp.]NLU09193.1 thiol peroxidase [Clostridiales bacterium]HBC95309.1 thiol peroxidase [Clostridium sp.]
MNLTFQGKSVRLSGSPLKVGDAVPNFTVINNAMDTVSLKDTNGVRIFLTVPSIDTPVCDLETRTFNEKTSEIPGVTVYTVSMDLPFAQSRWCAANGIKNVITVSDFKDRTFGKNFGTYMEDLGLLARTAFVVNSTNKITYVEYVPEVTNQPNFDAILNAAKKAK